MRPSGRMEMRGGADRRALLRRRGAVRPCHCFDWQMDGRPVIAGGRARRFRTHSSSGPMLLSIIDGGDAGFVDFVGPDEKARRSRPRSLAANCAGERRYQPAPWSRSPSEAGRS